MMKKIERKVGEVFHHDRLGFVVIVKDHGMGTIDVQTNDRKQYRITGLPLYAPVADQEVAA